MIRKVVLSALFLVAASAFASSGQSTAFAPENVVLIAPKEAPVSIASFDGSSDAKKLYIRVAFRNETDAEISGARVAMMVFDAERNIIGAATHRAGGVAAAGETILASFELPLMQPIDSAWQVVVVPIGATTADAGWEVPAQKLSPLARRLERARWSGAAQALAVGGDLIPRGERVQTYPPNCTLSECGANNIDCNNYCMAIGAHDTCAYCDRRRTGEPCSTTCYCRTIFESGCDPDPYL